MTSCVLRERAPLAADLRHAFGNLLRHVLEEPRHRSSSGR